MFKILQKYKLNDNYLFALKTKNKNKHIINKQSSIFFILINESYLKTLTKINKSKQLADVLINKSYIPITSIYDIGLNNIDTIYNIKVFLDGIYETYIFDKSLNKKIINNYNNDFNDIIVFKKCKENPYIINHLKSKINNDVFYENIVKNIDKNFIKLLVSNYKIDYFNKKMFIISFNQLYYLLQLFDNLLIDEYVNIFYSFDIYPYISAGYDKNLYIINPLTSIELLNYNYYKNNNKIYDVYVNNHITYKQKTVKDYIKKYTGGYYNV